jgi:peptide methionine sulfoxide reductase MsrA
VLAQFWESHNPTQGDRQGNDVGAFFCQLHCVAAALSATNQTSAAAWFCPSVVS